MGRGHMFNTQAEAMAVGSMVTARGSDRTLDAFCRFREGGGGVQEESQVAERRKLGANLWGNITSNPQLCPRGPHIPALHHVPFSSARTCHAVFFVNLCTCLPSLGCRLHCALCCKHSSEQENARPPHRYEPQGHVLWLRAWGDLPVLGSDGGRCSATQMPGSAVRAHFP